MRLTRINFFFNRKNRRKLFTFRESEHELVLLKRLDDNKIFYNNNIYDENFLDYNRLELFIKFINKHREQYINESFKKHIINMSAQGRTAHVFYFKSGYKDEWKRLTKEQYDILVNAYKYNFPYVPIEGVSNDDAIIDQAELALGTKVVRPKRQGDSESDEDEYDENNKLIRKKKRKLFPLMECRGINKEIPLIDCRGMNGSIDYIIFRKLIDEWLYIVGWRSIKPIYTVFKPALYKSYNDSDKVFMDIGKKNTIWYYYTEKENETLIEFDDEEIWLDLPDWWLNIVDPQNHFFVISPRIKRLKHYEEMQLYKANKDKPKNLSRETEEEEESDEVVLEKLRLKYKDTAIEFYSNDFYINFTDLKNPWIEESVLNNHEDTLNPFYNPMLEGSRLRHEWLEYDDNKKYNEFDIYCKTNSYHMRYKYYNEVYYKDYPEEKKFKTEPAYEFTEEEIKANFANMIDKEKTAIDKWNFVVKDGRNCDYLIDFLKKLYIIEYNYRIRYYWDYNYWYEEDDNNLAVYEKSKNKIYQMLNDPQYLLMMPVLDAFFEIFRINAWMQGDNTFFDFQLEESYFITEVKCLFFAMRLFDLSIERQDYLNFLDGIVVHEWLEDDDDDYIEQVDDMIDAILVTIFFAWLIGLTAYFGIFCLPIWDMMFVSPRIISRYSLSFEEYFYYRRPPIYYGIELRRPRLRVPYYARYKMPETFYDDLNYRFFKRRAKGLLPFSIMEILDEFIDQDDAGLGVIDQKLRNSAVKRGYDWRFKSER